AAERGAVGVGQLGQVPGARQRLQRLGQRAERGRRAALHRPAGAHRPPPPPSPARPPPPVTPSPRARPATSRSSRDLPMPASPTRTVVLPRPLCAPSNATPTAASPSARHINP